MLSLEDSNKLIGIVGESIQKIIELKEKLEQKRWKDKNAQLIYEGVNYCYLEVLEMHDKLEKFVLGSDSANCVEAEE